MAKEIKDEVRLEVEEWVAAGNRRPKLTAVIVGDDPASRTYVKNKMTAAKYTGKTTILEKFSNTCTELSFFQKRGPNVKSC